MIRSLKYHADLSLAPVLGKMLAAAAANDPRPDFLLPIPLHPQKLRERGFNQAHEIAAKVARTLKIPLLAAKRIRNTPPQTSLNWREREGNIRGAFQCEFDLSGKKVAVIDDVMTTGATQDEMAKVLLARGASEVVAWVVARTLPQD